MSGSSTKRGAVAGWIEDRLSLSVLRGLAEHKQVPQHRHSMWYYLGGMTLFLFLVQVATGILLLLYYRPTAEAAFESVEFIMTEVPFGWLMRSIHSWPANLMIFFLFVHMFSVFFLKAYRPPREITWMSGVGLFGLSLAFGFSGYLLPWNQLAYFATKVGTDIVSVMPVIGDWLLVMARGGEDVTGATLTRFFGVHVAILPMITTAILAIHLIMVQKQGMSVPVGDEFKKAPTMPFLPDFALRDALGWTLALGILVALATFFPWELGEKADPLASAPAGIKPEWFFLFMFQTLKYIPGHVWFIEGELLGVLGFGVAGVALLLVPFLDRRARQERPGVLFKWLGILGIVYIIIMSVLAWME